MFDREFYPTPPEVGRQMLELLNDVRGKTVLEPSAGAGSLVSVLLRAGANVIACEKEERLAAIVRTMCPLVALDFFDLRREQVSHISAIVMNPPFSRAERHIDHAWQIAPDGCEIVALCNYATLENKWNRNRESLAARVKDYGYSLNLGAVFSEAERHTDVEIGLVYLKKPASDYATEFDGFFLDDEPEEAQEYGVLQYDAVRDIVNRYVAAVKLYDEQAAVGRKLNPLIQPFLSASGYSSSEDLKVLNVPEDKEDEMKLQFRKGLQKRAWNYVFQLLDMQKYTTAALREDLNKFVEHQTNVPFTMRNIYAMLEIVVGTAASRMDKALEAVFDTLTKHYDENRYYVEGWKTNSHYMVNRKFILNHMVEAGIMHGSPRLCYSRHSEVTDDLAKALCYMTGTKYAYANDLRFRFDDKENPVEWGQWFDWGFFRCRCYKKGTMHFEFKDPAVWELFNKNIARIKGYPLPEAVKKTSKAQAQTAWA